MTLLTLTALSYLIKTEALASGRGEISTHTSMTQTHMQYECPPPNSQTLYVLYVFQMGEKRV